jgi:putative hydrolase of the HAD superfamily
MLKAIFFDIDNTILDFMTAKIRCVEAAVDAMISAGLKMNKDEALKAMFDLYDQHGIEEQFIFEKFMNKTEGKINYKIVAHGVIAYRKAREHYLKPYPHVTSTLLELKKHYQLGIISDAPVLQAWMRLVTLNLDDFFDVVITAASVRKQKLHAAPFRAALKALNVRPEEAMMVGDRIERDVKTPKSIGMLAVYARYGEQRVGKEPAPKGQSGADFELESFANLIEITKNLE